MGTMESNAKQLPEGEEALSAAERTRQELAAQLREAQKMEVVGRLAGGVAHDFNNVLTVILGYAELLQMQMAPDSPLCSFVHEIRKAGEHASGVAAQLLAFSRKQVLKPEVFDLNTVVAETQQMVRPLIGENIQLLIKLAPDLGYVKADRGQLVQVIMNLAANARDAMPQGGTLTLATSNVQRDENEVRPYPGAQPGPHVCLAIGDNGCGMEEEIKVHLFEPFFTTKEKGKGTGLGLATVHGIIQQSGGHIVVYSQLTRGSLFEIYLPRVEESASQPSERSRPPVGSLRGWETVLVVEDEPLLHSLLQRVLRLQGYTVLLATSSHEALTLCAQYPAPIHLLLTDVVMPHMSGHALAERMVPFRPELKVLYMSGHSDEIVFRHGVAEPGMAFLPKPFTPEVLARKIREVLDPETA
jgi:two-component system cell cycle sensor histidine kinase/response regulator CckA